MLTVDSKVKYFLKETCFNLLCFVIQCKKQYKYIQHHMFLVLVAPAGKREIILSKVT